MSDLVERLRRRGHPASTGGAALFNPNGPEAADEIVRLRALLARALPFVRRVDAELDAEDVDAAPALIREIREAVKP